jgi:Ca2+:H+ antiporter
VFAAVMITCNGIVGVSVLVGALRRHVASFNTEGKATALATVSTLAVLTLVLPTFTTSRPGAEFSPAQLAFASAASVALYALFVVVQTVRHRDYFLPDADDVHEHAAPPSDAQALQSLALLVVGVVIALLVLPPETLAAVRNAARDRMQTSFNLALVVVGALTVLPGRATVQEGGVHLVLFAAFLFLAVNP